MANELKIRVSLEYNPSVEGLAGVASGVLERLVDMAGADYSQGTQVIGAVEEQIVVSADIATQGWWLVVNTSDVQTVRLGPAGTAAADLLPGEFALFRTAAPLFAIADANTAMIQFWCFEV